MMKLSILLTLSAVLAGCGMPAGNSRVNLRQAVDPHRDTEAARKYNAAGAALLADGKHGKAEAKFKAAIKADRFFGPAHNNLGACLIARRKYHAAAEQYHFAAELMPRSPEPPNNLGLLYETIGNFDKALKWYETAHALAPENPEVAYNLARLHLRLHNRDARLRSLLEIIAMHSTQPNRVQWAKNQLALTPAATRPHKRNQELP